MIATRHVVPVDDGFDHDLTTTGCICGPRVETVEGGMIVIHNSLDGRERDETWRDTDDDD